MEICDMLIPDDEFISYTGTKEFEILEITEFKSDLFPEGTAYDILLGGLANVYGSIRGDYPEYKTFKTINFKVNPEIHVEIGWNLYGKYCKGIFFTSKEEKKSWTEKVREKKMNNHLYLARQYGYKG
jgi:hypothetical protein